MVNLGNHIIECIWTFSQALLGAVYLGLILLIGIVVYVLLRKFIIIKKENYQESQE